MNPTDEESAIVVEPVLVSWLNEYLFCHRRLALKAIEGVWDENAYTLEGSLLHDRADTPGVEERPGVRIARALPLFSTRLGLTGKADIVEFHRQPDGSETPYPVDYKRGRRRTWDNDDVQLCAQGLCLEEMLGRPVPAGAVFHAGSKRRREVVFDAALRALTERTIEEVRALLAAGRVPPAVLKPRCDGCSLRETCMPEVTEHPDRVARVAHQVFQVEADV
jgi:CRISPR-associated exonuclease Cas4